MEKVVTISRHITEQQRKYPQATGGFSDLLYDLTVAAKIISREVNKAGIVHIIGATGKVNVQGEMVQKLDIFAQRTIESSVDHGGHLCVMGSEESEDIIPIPKRYPKGQYILLFDPLDGSSNIDVNVSIGTIFSIHRRITTGLDGTLQDCLQPGYKQVAAGYIIYGSSTMFVYTAGAGVHGFTMDPSIGEFLLSHENIKIPDRGNIYSVNESNFNRWRPGTKYYIRYIKIPDKETGRPYKLRYIGSLVADFHRNLLTGGIFLYPEDVTDPGNPKPKLRLLYEAAPLGFIVEQAGGKASTGAERIMDIIPEGLHERVPLIIGSPVDVQEYEEFYQGKRTLE